ncbi:MAG: molybdenum ABC transporter ATP-binding protein [Nitratireductor sp.]
MGAISFAASGTKGDFTLDIGFDVPADRVSVLFGPSGCGKTTVLRCIAGLEKLNGHVIVAGRAWQDDASSVFLPPHQRHAGYVFQEASLFQHLCVADNLEYGRKRRRPAHDNGLSVAEMAAMLDIAHLLDRKPGYLSGGERQRVAIGRALLSSPQLLLLDEPFTGLDRRIKKEIIERFLDIRKRLGIPALYVSHDMAEVAALADEMILMADGRKVSQGSPAEIFERVELQPATGRFEAGSLVVARVLAHDERYGLSRLELAGQAMFLPGVDAAVGEEVRLRIRARDVSLALTRPGDISIRNILVGQITEIVGEPDTAFAETVVDLGDVRIRARITRMAVDELRLAAGSKVHALIKSVSFDRRV